MRILALDIATHCGWAAHPYGSGVWDLSPVTATKKRAASDALHRERTLWLRLAAHYGTPLPGDALVIEDSEGFNYKGKRAHEVAANLRGVCKAFCALHSIGYHEVHPVTLKKATTGKGNAGKDKMLAYAKNNLGLQSDNEDEADALCLLDYFTSIHAPDIHESWRNLLRSCEPFAP